MTDELKPAEFKEIDRIVVIVAHHDDIEFGLAGSVARWVRDGAQVTYIIVTDGGAGSNDPDITRAELVEKRRLEQLAASAAVGVTDTRFLGYPDGMLQPTLELRRHLTRLLREIKPQRVVCQDPTTVFAGDGYVNHPDHRAAGEAAIYAVFPSSETRPIFPELLAEGFEPHKIRELYLTLTMKPTHFVDTSETHTQKLDALRCHVSQIGAGDEAENGAIKWISEWDTDTGKKVGVTYAESFKVMQFDQPPAPEEPAATEVETIVETVPANAPF